MKKCLDWISLSLCIFFIAACSPAKYVPENKALYHKTQIQLINPEKINQDKQVKADLAALARPIPNARLKLGIYNFFYTQKKKGLGQWLAKKLGSPPVVAEEMQLERSRLRMEKYLKDKGYFNASITLDTSVQKRKLDATYRIFSNGQYQIRNVIPLTDSTQLGKILQTFEAETILKSGDFYNQQNLNQERSRLASLANDQGYPDFSTEHIYYFVDTTAGNLQADIYLKINPLNDSTAHQFYRLNDVFIFQEHNLNNAGLLSINDTIQKKDGMFLIQNQATLRPNVLDRAIAQDKGDHYSKKFQDITVNHLLELGVFRFVNLKYTRQKIGDENMLNRFLYLTPDQMQDVTGELELNNRTGNYLGVAATLTYTHKNLFQGAERLNVSATGGLETQLGSGISLINSADLNLQAGISAPVFLSPFKGNNRFRVSVPRTEFKIGFTFQRRIEFYSINSIQLSFGYRWRKNRKVRHEFYPLLASRVQLTNRKPAFEELLNKDPRLARSFENVFIAGLKYIHVFSNQESELRQNYWFTRSEIETSGNASGLLADEIYGLPLSQFVKINTDVRYNFLFRKTSLITRFLLGAGFAYGNSEVLPYSRQFFVGGSNSLRAFRLRGLGPGSFVDDTVDNGAIENQFIDQTGDLKLELNLEYRFPIMSYLKGAIFVDAGNIWLTKSEDRPEGIFHFNTFYKEIAIGTGLGLRLDFDYVLIRLDAAFALRKAFLQEGFQWTFDQLNFGAKDWRKENLTWNIGIGYPF